MGKYTRDRPKGMLELNGKPLLQWQIETLYVAGVESIVIVTGYRKDTIRFQGIKYYHNGRFASTNMIESLMCAKKELNSDVLISYSDVLYTPDLVRRAISEPGEIVVAVDSAWRDYWKMRYGTTEEDLETLTVRDGLITELGREVESSKGINYRYIGVLKFSKNIWPDVLSLYENKKSCAASWRPSGRPFSDGFMTDLLNELIENGVPVKPCVTAKQWLEFDSEADYETVCKQQRAGKLTQFFSTAGG
jgi:choline kinase